VPFLKSACVLDGKGGLTVFAVNRSLDDRLELSADFRGLGRLRLHEWTSMSHPDRQAINTTQAPDAVKPKTAPRAAGARVTRGELRAVLKPASWNVIRLSRSA
jgi:alpha-N-arabinofuranosidase